jgi:hypothetical protein
VGRVSQFESHEQDHRQPFAFSVTFPDELITITTPILKAGSIVEEKSAASAHVRRHAINALALVTNRCPQEHISFLPLPADFNHEDRTQWMVLADSIQDWLVAEEPLLQDKELWKWGTEAFWVAFTAAYPAFPHGEWPFWNTKINMEGGYIESWLENLSSDNGSEDDAHPNEVWELGVVWQHFQQLLSHVPL